MTQARLCDVTSLLCDFSVLSASDKDAGHHRGKRWVCSRHLNCHGCRIPRLERQRSISLGRGLEVENIGDRRTHIAQLFVFEAAAVVWSCDMRQQHRSRKCQLRCSSTPRPGTRQRTSKHPSSKLRKAKADRTTRRVARVLSRRCANTTELPCKTATQHTSILMACIQGGHCT